MSFRTQAPSNGDTEGEAGLSRYGRGRHHRGSALPKYYTIKAVAEAVDVSPRTVRRWIAKGYLVVHRVDGVVRIADDDLGAFLALHRES
jgi:excisionase family DNA binding protein